MFLAKLTISYKKYKINKNIKLVKINKMSNVYIIYIICIWIYVYTSPVVRLTCHLDRIDFSKVFGSHERFSMKKNISLTYVIFNIKRRQTNLP